MIYLWLKRSEEDVVGCEYEEDWTFEEKEGIFGELEKMEEKAYCKFHNSSILDFPKVFEEKKEG